MTTPVASNLQVDPIVAREKEARLRSLLKEMNSVVVAYSGGVDSTYLAAVAHEVLGNQALAVTALSLTYPDAEAEEAKVLARRLALNHVFIETKELEDPHFVANDRKRCYYCKKELFAQLSQMAEEQGRGWVLDGSNSDDLGDYRPGRVAAGEAGVRSPLLEVGLTKAEIRFLSQERGLPTWDKPAQACLASRFPYGTSLTDSLLKKVAEAEAFLKSLGARQVRVRHHGRIARLEVDPESLPLFLEEEKRKWVVAGLRALGYTYVTLDLAGYRPGSLNELL